MVSVPLDLKGGRNLDSESPDKDTQRSQSNTPGPCSHLPPNLSLALLLHPGLPSQAPQPQGPSPPLTSLHGCRRRVGPSDRLVREDTEEIQSQTQDPHPGYGGQTPDARATYSASLPGPQDLLLLGLDSILHSTVLHLPWGVSSSAVCRARGPSKGPDSTC